MRNFFLKIKETFQIYPILPGILVLLTWKARYLPEIKWNKKSWTHNVFRFYEKLFWRRWGIKPEMSATSIVDANGKQTVTYRCHSFESIFALAEQYIRGFFKSFKFVELYIPKLASVEGFSQQSPFMFAIAFDTSNKNFAASGANSYSYTCTGSDLCLLNFGNQANNNTPVFASTYNAVSMTATSANVNTGSNQPTRLFLLTGPATGSNTLEYTSTTTTGGLQVCSASYSGVKQTGQPSAHLEDTPANALNYTTPTITTVDDNSWVTGGFYSNVTATDLVGTTTRQRDATNLGTSYADKNAPITPAGGATMGWLGSNSNTSWVAVIVAISPFVVTTVIKSVSGVPQASIKSVSTVPLASIKSVSSVPNV